MKLLTLDVEHFRAFEPEDRTKNIEHGYISFSLEAVIN